MNDGTPTKATNEPSRSPIARARERPRRGSRSSRGSTVQLPPIWSSATTTPAMPLTKPIERSISPSSSTKTTPIAIIVVPAICDDQVAHVPGGEEVVVLRLEEDRDQEQPDDDREAAHVAGADAVQPAADVRADAVLVDHRPPRRGARRPRSSCLRPPSQSTGSPVPGDAGDLRRHTGGDRVDDLLLGRLLTLVDGDCATEAQHRDPVATSKMSCRLCEMITTASPCVARRFTSSSTCRVCATPSAAVGSSRITRREFHITARATATDWRWPPERLATFCRVERMVVTARPFIVSAVFASISVSRSRPITSWASRPRYMFWTTSRLSQSARSW